MQMKSRLGVYDVRGHPANPWRAVVTLIAIIVLARILGQSESVFDNGGRDGAFSGGGG